MTAPAVGDRHQCPAPGCGRRVPYHQLMCRTHWFAVPKHLRDAVYATWRLGAGAGSPEHTQAIEAAIASLACGRCGNPVAKPGETRPSGNPSLDAQFCEPCQDRCHEATEFDHICQVCATPDEARARGWAVTR